jgi:hypothetical protein
VLQVLVCHTPVKNVGTYTSDSSCHRDIDYRIAVKSGVFNEDLFWPPSKSKLKYRSRYEAPPEGWGLNDERGKRRLARMTTRHTVVVG